MPRITASRFGIGEWYGHSFIQMTSDERRSFANAAINHTAENAPTCPFQGSGANVPCSKKGGICSLRLYNPLDDGAAIPAEGDNGRLRIVCPNRFKQDNIVNSAVADFLIDTKTPQAVPEVRFLRRHGIALATDEVGRSETEGRQSEDVGNIDLVLVNPESTELVWCALEIQAVYFSGSNMNLLFQHVADYAGQGIPFRDRVRRPDYRSSGAKRLMPQLQTKVPTLRRWGKKMAVVVDVPWFRTNVAIADTVSDVSNSDIAWFLFDIDETSVPPTLRLDRIEMQTLERAVEGLTGGLPVTLAEFESKMREKLSRLS